MQTNYLKNKCLFILNICVLAFIGSATFTGSVYGQNKMGKPERYFGFHFDFHATKEDKLLGENFDKALLTAFLNRTHPDFIQVDSKGHFGYSSYPTKVGYSSNSFAQDPLRIFRDVTRKLHLPLYVHYSGLWDTKAINENLRWARIKVDGTKDSTKAGYYSAYLDSLMVPQLKELISDYQIDGIWVDGDCWATGLDYSPQMIKKFNQKTGIMRIPDKSQPDYTKWVDFNRDAFKQYMRHYIDQIHAYKPTFQIASNWAYSSMMPEPVDVNVDFLSGDVAGKNSVYSSAFEARCLALQSKPWDLMSWGLMPVDFWGLIHSYKPVIQLKQEAAQVLAMGGGYQVYFQQNRDGGFRTLDIESLGSLADFVRARQPFCQYGKVVPQIGMWYSMEGWRKNTKRIYGPSTEMLGLNSLLLDGQHSVEILMDHHLAERLDAYPLIVIPEWDTFDTHLKSKLLKYVEAGGKLLIIGSRASQAFSDQLNVKFLGSDTLTQLNMGGEMFGGIAGLRTRWQRVKADEDATVLGYVYSQTDYRYPTDFPVATVNAYGQGEVACVYMDLSEAYLKYKSPVFNSLINSVIRRLMPEPILKVGGSEKVHTVLTGKDGHLFIHLINVNGSHANEKVYGYTELPPLPLLKVSLKLDSEPKDIILQPSSTKLEFRYENGRVDISVPSIEIYDIIEVLTF